MIKLLAKVVVPAVVIGAKMPKPAALRREC
jgi:hypothetical protein